MWSAAQRKRSTDLMLLLGLNKTVDQLVIANSVHWYGYVLRIGWSCLEDIRFCGCGSQEERETEE